MDEILLANFMVFHDLVRDEDYDLWIGDEAWELDYYLHENPEEKRAAYVWLTDFVGWLPMPDGGDAEMRVTADYNAEMIEQIARYPRVRDRAIFVGSPLGHCAGHLWRRSSGDSRLDRETISSFRATSPDSIHPSSLTANASAPNLATALTSRCASSPSEVPAWATTCCAR